VRPRANRDTERLQEEVAERLGTSVEIRPGKKGRGKLVIGYMSHEHLDQLLDKLMC
jgi:ParB family chromosome partitioning protein